jgi:4-hydroxy-3-polyprenylbenzoate decarboxylase
LPQNFSEPRLVAPGILAIRGPDRRRADTDTDIRRDLENFCGAFRADDAINRYPLITIVDDANFTANRLENWLWVTFTRSNPAVDINGIEGSTVHRHWGCRGSLVIDARAKPHHAPPVVESPETIAKVDARASRGGQLARYL